MKKTDPRMINRFKIEHAIKLPSFFGNKSLIRQTSRTYPNYPSPNTIKTNQLFGKHLISARSII